MLGESSQRDQKAELMLDPQECSGYFICSVSQDKGLNFLLSSVGNFQALLGPGLHPPYGIPISN